MKSQIIYSQILPHPGRFPDESVLFYDSVLAKNKDFKNWARTFRFKIALRSGESLKTIDSLKAVLNKISKMDVAKSTNLTFIGVGGGSIGDFVGFAASVFLRGRKLVLIPSTWLAAVDSSHGGKNGLNFLKTKNQLGSFYLPEKIYICKNLLLSQPPERLTESYGEIIKAAVLCDRHLFARIEKLPADLEIFKLLPKLIALKYRIVEQDFLEKNGKRRLLNLGHTMGHVFETAYGWPHGISVLLGLQFAVRWSFHQGRLKAADFFRISMLIDSLDLKQDLKTALRRLKRPKLVELLGKDKKLTAHSRLDFIFVNQIGKCQRQSVSIAEILNEVNRQNLEY